MHIVDLEMVIGLKNVRAVSVSMFSCKHLCTVFFGKTAPIMILDEVLFIINRKRGIPLSL